MCRLFGQHAPPDVDRSAALLTSENALRFQSHRHPHGWGIGWYVDGRVKLRRGILPAHADAAFLHAARAARSQIVVAHVRDASIGPVTTVNTHPFRCGRWLFAHNGTVARYRRSRAVREGIEAEIAPFYRRRIRGATDSERIFYLFLTRLTARDAVEDATLADVRRALAETTRTVSGIADSHDAVSSLNFLVSDGRVLAACRRGRTLHLATGAGPDHDVLIASEPIGSGAWEEIPEGGFVGTDDGRRVLRANLIASHGKAAPAGTARASEHADATLRRRARSTGAGDGDHEPPSGPPASALAGGGTPVLTHRYSSPLTSAPRGKRTS